ELDERALLDVNRRVAGHDAQPPFAPERLVEGPRALPGRIDVEVGPVGIAGRAQDHDEPFGPGGAGPGDDPLHHADADGDEDGDDDDDHHQLDQRESRPAAARGPHERSRGPDQSQLLMDSGSLSQPFVHMSTPFLLWMPFVALSLVMKLLRYFTTSSEGQTRLTMLPAWSIWLSLKSKYTPCRALGFRRAAASGAESKLPLLWG